MTIVSGQGTSSILVNRASSSSASVQATLTVSGSTFTISKTNIQSGTKVPSVLLCPVDPTYPGTVGAAVTYGVTGTDYWLYAKGTSTVASDYRWRLYPSDPFMLPVQASGQKTSFSKTEPGEYTISLQYNGTCGWSNEEFSIIRIEQNYYLNLSPNPATNTVTISLSEQQSSNSVQSMKSAGSNAKSYEIQLWNSFGLVKSEKANQAEYQLDLQGLPAGFYYVHAVYNGVTTRKQLIVK